MKKTNDCEKRLAAAEVQRQQAEDALAQAQMAPDEKDRKIESLTSALHNCMRDSERRLRELKVLRKQLGR